MHRAEDRGSFRDVRLATCLIKGADFFQCLESVITGLRDRGWVVEDLEAFQIGVHPDEICTDEDRREMYEMAEAGGFAFRLSDAPEFQTVAGADVCRPMGS